MVANCELVWREVSNYVDGGVDPALRSAMDEHFQSCPKCRSVLAGMRNVVGLYADERMLEVPAGFGRRLERRLAANARASSRWSSWTAWLVPVAALALITGAVRFASSLTVTHPLQSAHAQPAHDIPPDLVVVVSADAKTFHVPGCEFIHNKDTVRTLTAKEAVREGYIPCLRCMRKYLSTTASAQRPATDAEPEFVAEDQTDVPGRGR
jgi:hypothetical protein